MTDYLYTGKGVGAFIVFYIIGYVLSQFLPIILNTIVSAGATGSTFINQIGQFIMIIVWIVGMIIIPNYFYLRGIQTESESEPIVQILVSIFVMLFAFLFLYKGYFMITALANFIGGGFLLGVYWIGILTTLLFAFVVTPIVTIIQASPKGQ